jgi:methionyl-tRNA synthetase
MDRIEFSGALESVMAVVSQANRYIEVTAPWKLAKDPSRASRLQTVLNVLAEVIRIVSLLLEPFMPAVAGAIWVQLGCGSTARQLQDAARWPGLNAGQAIGPHPVLFPRLEAVASS